MQDVHFRHNNLTTAEVRSGHLHHLHRVKLFSAAICHITQGSKVIIQDENRLVAGPGELIIIPANTPLEIINQPEQGAFRSDLLLLSTSIITAFKNNWVEDFPPAKLTSLCTPMSNGLAFMWESLLDAVRGTYLQYCRSIRRWDYCWRYCMMVWRGLCLSSGGLILLNRCDN